MPTSLTLHVRAEKASLMQLRGLIDELHAVTSKPAISSGFARSLRRQLNAVRADAQAVQTQMGMLNKKMTTDAAVQSKARVQLEKIASAERIAIVKVELGARKAVELKAQATRLAAEKATNKAVVADRAKSMGAMHSMTRGAAGASGKLWLTYGSIAPMAAGFGSAIAAKNVFAKGSEFEYQMNFLEALEEKDISGEIASIKSELMNMQGVLHGPLELAEGMRELRKAGVEVKQALIDVRSVSQLATVGELNMAAAAKIAVTSTKAFGGTVEQNANIIAKAASLSATNVSEIGQALTYLSETGMVAGASLADVNTLLAVMAQRSIAGSKAGTSMRTSMVKLAAPSKKAAEMLRNEGIELYNLETGAMRAITDWMPELINKMDRMTDIERNPFIHTVLGLRAMKAGSAWAAEGADNFESLHNKISQSANGTAFLDRALSKLTKGAGKQWTLALNELESAVISAFEVSGPLVKDLAQDFSEFVESDEFGVFLEEMSTGVAKLGKMMLADEGKAIRTFFDSLATAATAGGKAADLIKGMAESSGLLLDTYNEFPAAVKVAGIFGIFAFGLTGLSVAVGITTTVAALKQFSAGGWAQELLYDIDTMYIELEKRETKGGGLRNLWAEVQKEANKYRRSQLGLEAKPLRPSHQLAMEPMSPEVANAKLQTKILKAEHKKIKVLNAQIMKRPGKAFDSMKFFSDEHPFDEDFMSVTKGATERKKALDSIEKLSEKYLSASDKLNTRKQEISDLFVEAGMEWDTELKDKIFKDMDEKYADQINKTNEFVQFQKQAYQSIGTFAGSALYDYLEGRNVTLADSFRQMINKMIADFARMQLMKGMFGANYGTGTNTGFGSGLLGTAAASIGKMFFAADGGISPGHFQPIQAFANGSPNINRPTLGVVGEGRYPEAIVPLPDGRSIPVVMSGGSSGGISMPISVVVQSSGASTGDAEAQKKMGMNISKAIKQEMALVLIDAQRPGGLLNKGGYR